MNLIELQQYTISEVKSEEYLQAELILERFDQCPYCASTRIGRIRRDKYKCYGCREGVGTETGKYP